MEGRILLLKFSLGIGGFVHSGLAQSLPAGQLPLAERYHQRALALASAGDVGAGDYFRKAWEEDPTAPLYVHDVTVYYVHRHEYAQALAVIRDFIGRVGTTPLAWTLQGELLFEQKRYDEAYQSLKRALETSNDNYRAHELLGLIFSVHRRYTLALEELTLAAQQNPRSAQVRFYCGRLHYQVANYASALSEFQACLSLSPTYPRALENLGLTYEALNEISTASALYRKAIEYDKTGKTPPSESPYVCLAALLGGQGGETEARQLLAQALARNPHSAWATFELGKLQFKANEYVDAERSLRRAAELDPNYSRPHFLLGTIYRRTNRIDQASAEFAIFQALDKEPENRQPQITR